MSRFQKIFLASALVVVGFGVAKFLGQPVKLPESLRTYTAQTQAVVLATQSANAKAEVPRTGGSVRLLPDAQVTRANSPDAPVLGSALSPVLATSDSRNVGPMARTVEFAPFDSSKNLESGLPRATLRNEAPRPVGVDPQSPAAIRRTPPASDAAADPYKVGDASVKLADAPNASMNWPAPQLMTAGYAAPEAAVPPSPTAIAASYNQPVSPPVDNQLAPPPWPVSDENAEPRTHIIVDGDTLEKLAGRYLTDPQRSREIFELNSSLLASPDLLPIGAELKIPERIASVPRERQNWQPNSSIGRPNLEASRDKMTPVQPASAPGGIVPRAQLSRPVMVE